MVINESINDIYFDASLNCLITDVTIDYLFEVRQSTLIDEYFLRMLCTIGSWAMWNRLKRSHSTSVKWKNQPTFFQLNNETDRLLRGILTYINRHFRENPMSNVQVAVFTWAQSIMDVIPFVPFFVKTGYPEATLEWLSIEPNETMISLRSWRESLDFVHNLARHESGVKALNQLGAISILKAWKGRYLSESTLSNDENYEDLRVVYYMSYALLLEPALLKRENSMDLQVALDHILDRAVQAFQSTSLHYGPYHVSEFWTALARFTVNDECLLYMLIREDMFEFSMQKFLEYNKLLLLDVNSESSDLDTLMCSLLYTIFWSISFQTNYHVKLKTNTEFVGFIQQTAKKNSNDGYVGSIRQSANGILFNLDLIQQSHLPSKPDIDDHIDGVKVMISYSHKDSAFCRRLVNTLKDQVQGDLWVDFIKLEPPYEDDWEEIAEAISNCDVVAMIVTADYCSSKSCRREVIHSDKRNKPMIPIYQGSEYEPDDWFEIRAGSATWVRFGSMNSDEEVMQTLVKLINSHKKTKNRSDVAIVSQKPYLENNHTVPPIMILTQTSDILSSPLPDPVPLLPLPTSNLTTSSLVTTPRKPIEQWTSEEVHQWLCLPPSILQFSSGRALLAYARLIPDEDAERDEYERSLKKRGLTREQWANLICSLKTLRLLHIMETSSKALPEQWSSDEVKCWFEQNKLSNYLIDTFAFVDGMELVIYAKMMTTALVRIDSEYDRLRTRIQARYNGQDLLQLDEYVRLVRALKKIVEQSQL
ncbi:unnamed protein product [Rotaria sp. Silwood1]|nr:unnamed protein product [Rotaria sp. Silwood1]CAF1263505.1 unnamed protein product [Rotaria sp. Silwood1]CAF3489997.1 unnamed protein product [Rotaria sp. Silwood1]CAF3509269.1 unnamed protein product [Rotaria sp. Silwood1]CAF4789746.1 unnamed protein product [Rotaria sp. Silwood1]